MSQVLGTIWVCGDCLHHHANGECGSCHDDHGHDKEPLSALEDNEHVAMGMMWEDHNDECLKFVLYDLRDRFPDMVWPDIPGDYECDCETDTYSWVTCQGCYSRLHGERHAMTLFTN